MKKEKKYVVYGFEDVILPEDVALENNGWITFKDLKGNAYETKVYFHESISEEEAKSYGNCYLYNK